MSFTKSPTKASTGTGVKDGLVKKKMFVPEVSLSNVKNVPKEFQDILRSALGVLFKKFTENYNNRIMRYGNFEEIEFLKSEPQEMLSNFINIYGNIVANDPSDKLVKIDKIVIKFLEGFVNEKEKSLKAFLNEKQVKKVETVAEKPREEFANFHDFYIHY
ncbi:hypothetical protein DASC09_012580 [Saccharomycopsis crataegensis]|uniref:Uncharacterized protein n=1 Tax=Saccharomycopsis crataegensis TaxID=43959 RepID=A0AAV5QGG3_9ASCO|nr:hypothetical protein DASC09_012580 [Saccharomycopsis crataegensis]